MKKLLMLSALIIALMAACLVGCDLAGNGDGETSAPATSTAAPPPTTAPSAAATPATVFTLDVNPGVRVSLDEAGLVIAAEATNEDGEGLLLDLTLTGLDYEAAVAEIVDALSEAGYLEATENAVLLTFESAGAALSEELNAAIDAAFESHGKRAAIIEQMLDELDTEVENAIGTLAERHGISEGKAHLIEKIREEMPELSAESLAGMPIADLGLLLDGLSESLKGFFGAVELPERPEHLDREAVLAAALASLEITDETAVSQVRIRVTGHGGQMCYDVELVHGGMRYNLLVDIKTAEVLATESEEYRPLDLDSALDDFSALHGVPKELIGILFGQGSDGEALTKGAILRTAMTFLGLDEEDVARSDVRLHQNGGGAYYEIRIDSTEGDRYEMVVEAYSGTPIRAACNGITVELTGSLIPGGGDS